MKNVIGQADVNFGPPLAIMSFKSPLPVVTVIRVDVEVSHKIQSLAALFFLKSGDV